MQENPRTRAGQSRAQTPALPRDLLFGSDGRALTPIHTRKSGGLYRYYRNQGALKGGANDASFRRLPAGEIEGLVMDHVCALLRQPEIIVGTWRAAQTEAPDITETGVCEALGRLDPLWDELFPREQAQIVRLLVERVTVGDAGADIKLNLEGLAGLVCEFGVPRAAINGGRHDQRGERDGAAATDVPFRRHGGRKMIVMPDGVQMMPGVAVSETRGGPALVKTLARAFRWRQMLETGAAYSVSDIARQEKLNTSYVTRVLRLTLLAPNIVEAVLERRPAPEMTLLALLRPLPDRWDQQRDAVSARPAVSAMMSSNAPNRRDQAI